LSEGSVFSALDGSNPLAFLAALGALRLLQLTHTDAVRMRWVRSGVWNPEVSGLAGSEESLCDGLASAAKAHLPVQAFSQLGKNITVDKETFEAFIRTTYDAARAGERAAADFAAAFECEVCEQEGKHRSSTPICASLPDRGISTFSARWRRSRRQ
jgi:hypothetical protein